jgi:HEPN domain-containing protein
MPPEESRYPQDWFRIGEKDLQRTRILLRAGDLEGAGFNLQQALEKYLKGFLLGKGWSLRRIHDLEILLNETIKLDPSFEIFRSPCQKITQYYLEERYPFTAASELVEEEIRQSLAFAEQLIAKIQTS